MLGCRHGGIQPAVRAEALAQDTGQIIPPVATDPMIPRRADIAGNDRAHRRFNLIAACQILAMTGHAPGSPRAIFALLNLRPLGLGRNLTGKDQNCQSGHDTAKQHLRGPTGRCSKCHLAQHPWPLRHRCRTAGKPAVNRVTAMPVRRFKPMHLLTSLLNLL